MTNLEVSATAVERVQILCAVNEFRDPCKDASVVVDDAGEGQCRLALFVKDIPTHGMNSEISDQVDAVITEGQEQVAPVVSLNDHRGLVGGTKQGNGNSTTLYAWHCFERAGSILMRPWTAAKATNGGKSKAYNGIQDSLFWIHVPTKSRREDSASHFSSG